MAKTQKADFVVEYENGMTITISVNRYTISRSNYWALRVAEQWQQEDRIPAGTIRAVRRIQPEEMQEGSALSLAQGPRR